MWMGDAETHAKMGAHIGEANLSRNPPFYRSCCTQRQFGLLLFVLSFGAIEEHL